MPTNYPSPYTLKWVYNVGTIVHKQQLCINVTNSPLMGDDFSEIIVTTRGGSNVALSNYVGTFFNLYKALFNSGTIIGDVELWKNVPNSFDMTFVSANGDTYTGTQGSPAVLSMYSMYTFRSANGGIFKLLALENIYNRNDQLNYGAMTASEKAVVDHIRGTGNAFLARDNGFPTSFVRASYGQNEKIWRKRNRPNY